jgi:hypothetical protein
LEEFVIALAISLNTFLPELVENFNSMLCRFYHGVSNNNLENNADI